MDGGGVRGVAAVTIINTVLEDLEERTGKTDLEHVHQLFDVMAGTSTGGLISLLYGRLRVPAHKLVNIYASLSKSLFEAHPVKKFIRGKFGGATYSASRGRIRQNRQRL